MEGINMLEEHERQSNHRPKEESMDMTDIHMVEVESMDMVAEHPSKERPEVDGIDTEEEGMDTEEEHPSKERPKVEDMKMVKDMTVEVVKKEHNDVVSMRH
jgi:hypothetical protein